MPRPLKDTDYQAQLAELIGISEAKAQVDKIIAFAKLKHKRATLGLKQIPIALNMEFVGNPGTAKTTVARMVAGIMKEVGLLSSEEMVEVGRSG